MRYEILPRFALGLGTKHDATGDVERGFSTMNLIHQNKQRNTMEQDTLNAHLLIRAGVEAKEVTKLCDKCKASPTDDHCHCELFEVTDLIRAKCKVAWQKCLPGGKCQQKWKRKRRIMMLWKWLGLKR